MEATLTEADVRGMEGGSPQEASLVQACKEGDQTAFNLLVWRWEKPLFNFTYKYIGDAQLAQDMVQETFIRVLRSIRTYEHRGAFSTWLYRIAVNLCKDHFRKKKLPMVSLHDYYTTSSGDRVYVKDSIADDAPRSDEAMAAADREEMVRRLLAGLPEEQRVVILMKEYQTLTFREIAEVLEIPEGTVKARLYRGLRTMREQLERSGVMGPGSGGMQ
ncbi:MAG: sigma-70 family RNA polymerase sigma factor [Acidobacteriota bacterium]|jgi:RNA polymerase sigma-70 factor (ECF subfamily)